MKKKTIYFLIFLVLIIGAIVASIIYFKNDSKNAPGFSLSEQRWIESNKNNVIDFYIPSDIDVFSYSGKGVFFDFLDSFTEETGLKINKTSYKLTSKTKKEYSFGIKDTLTKKDHLLYKDNYIVLSKDETIYKEKDFLRELSVGILESDLELAEEIFKDYDISFKSFETFNGMMESYLSEENDLDAVITLKTLCLNYMFENELHINYQIKEMTKNFVITLNGDSVLNSIFLKYFKKWYSKNYENSYNSHLLNEYYELNKVTELEKNSLQEKKYIYGFVSNGAYDCLKSNKLYGINYQIIKSFASFANIDMDFHDEFLSYEDLVKSFDSGKIDLFFQNGKYNITSKYLETTKPISTKVVILSNVKNKENISSLYSLKDDIVYVVKKSYIEKYLINNGIKVKSYNSLDKLLNNIKDDTIIAIDLENYEYYKSTKLLNYKIAYQLDLDKNYGYVVDESDIVFFELLDFYLQYVNINDVIVLGYDKIYHIEKGVNVLLIISIVMFLILCLEFVGHLRNFIKFLKNKSKRKLTKNDKIKYIDQLTSLKNRLYLNDAIEKWDNSSIYPQSIIVVELNDLSAINSNFGHEEGDRVILEAANILIRTQLPNTEIIRTDGSEFLIYMIEYDEKQTVAYLRKLNKELKELSHGYGAVTGYSIISDGIKTIDDAINEATLDVRTNKELLDEIQQ